MNKMYMNMRFFPWERKSEGDEEEEEEERVPPLVVVVAWLI